MPRQLSRFITLVLVVVGLPALGLNYGLDYPQAQTLRNKDRNALSRPSNKLGIFAIETLCLIGTEYLCGEWMWMDMWMWVWIF